MSAVLRREKDISKARLTKHEAREHVAFLKRRCCSRPPLTMLSAARSERIPASCYQVAVPGDRALVSWVTDCNLVVRLGGAGAEIAL